MLDLFGALLDHVIEHRLEQCEFVQVRILGSSLRDDLSLIGGVVKARRSHAEVAPPHLQPIRSPSWQPIHPASSARIQGVCSADGAHALSEPPYLKRSGLAPAKWDEQILRIGETGSYEETVDRRAVGTS